MLVQIDLRRASSDTIVLVSHDAAHMSVATNSSVIVPEISSQTFVDADECSGYMEV